MSKLTTEDFIMMAKSIHGEKYDYSKVNYINSNTKVCIICKEHGEFWQSPNKHISCKHGCIYCSKNKGSIKLTTEEFIQRAKNVNGDKFDYSKSNYNNAKTNIIIICKKHGEFLENPYSHCNAKIKFHCPKCRNEYLSNKYKMTNEEFIKRLKVLYGEDYDYSKVEYNGYDEKVLLYCKKHGDFYRKSEKLLMGYGCYSCQCSIGERKIINWLNKNNIFYEKEKTFKECKYKNVLRFDFYLKDYNICIEYDGKQHFIPFDFSNRLSEEEKINNLKDLQIKDKIKNDFCLINNIRLIRIKYNENIDEKLNEIFFTEIRQK